MRPWPEFAPLLDLAADVGEVIDLDAIAPEQRRRDVADYVAGLLELLPGYATAAHSAGRRAFAEAVAATLTADSTPPPGNSSTDDGEQPVRWGEFLVASLYTHTVSLNSPDQLGARADAARLGSCVPRTFPEVLELDMAARPASRWRQAVLTVLAHARGAGIPRTALAAVAAAVAGEATRPSEAEMAGELDALRFYLRTSVETEASSLYRLFTRAWPITSVAGVTAMLVRWRDGCWTGCWHRRDLARGAAVGSGRALSAPPHSAARHRRRARE